MGHPTFAVVSALVLGAMAGCGSSVERPDGSGGAGGADDVTSTGSGDVASTMSSTGAGGAPGAGGAGEGAGGGGEGGHRECGGFGGLACDADEWCDFPDDLCGGADGMGVCTPRPGGCDEDCPGVCGCDGAFHCNACIAQAAGVDVSGTSRCAEDEARYSAEAFFGGLDHLLIRKADAERDVCVTLHLTRPDTSTPGFDFSIPEEWGVADASITDQASDCEGEGDPPGTTVQATGGSGTISFVVPPDGFFPCDVTVHGVLSFPAGEPFVLEREPLDADGVRVVGGCL